jgi:phage N-6-adenine-methyltransferase
MHIETANPLSKALSPKCGAGLNRHRSKQDYATPPDFMAEIHKRFGHPTVDLAASAVNTKAHVYITEEQNSLTVGWSETYLNCLAWLNPPFNDIEPWAMKCAVETAKPHSRLRILLLTPASIGSAWFSDWVHKRAIVIALSPRLSFDGVSPYPKDCMLSCFGFGVSGFEVWRWKR